MRKFLKEKWMWLVYITMFGALITGRIYVFVAPSEPAHLYYKIMMIMGVNQQHFPSAYILTIASFILSVFTLIFLWLYTFNIKKFSALFILLIIAARIVCDLLGHSYEFNTIKSLYYQSESAAWIAAANLFFWLLPSYLAMGDYVIQKIKSRHINKQQ